MTLHSKVIAKVTSFFSRKSVRDPNSNSIVSLNPWKNNILCLLLRFLEIVFWNTHYLRSQPQNDQNLFVPSEEPIPTHTHTHTHSKTWLIKLNCLLLIIFWFLRLSVCPIKNYLKFWTKVWKVKHILTILCSNPRHLVATQAFQRKKRPVPVLGVQVLKRMTGIQHKQF